MKYWFKPDAIDGKLTGVILINTSHGLGHIWSWCHTKLNRIRWV